MGTANLARAVVAETSEAKHTRTSVYAWPYVHVTVRPAKSKELIKRARIGGAPRHHLLNQFSWPRDDSNDPYVPLPEICVKTQTSKHNQWRR